MIFLNIWLTYGGRNIAIPQLRCSLIVSKLQGKQNQLPLVYVPSI